MNTHQLKASLLSLPECMTVKSMLRMKAGELTVRQAREELSPRMGYACATAAGMFLFFVALGALFVPLIFLAPLGALYPFMVLLDRKRWLKLLPPERDADLVDLVP